MAAPRTGTFPAFNRAWAWKEEPFTLPPLLFSLQGFPSYSSEQIW